MWWSSFCSVLDDLVRFALGREQAHVLSGQAARSPTRHSFTPPTVPVQAPGTIQLAENIRYTAKHDDTVAIRSYLQKETTVKIATADLTIYEYLAYVFTSNGRPLPWMALAMAAPGFWHQALKGQSYVTIGISPQTQSLMEWQDKSQTGNLAYVTSVSPDETVICDQLGDDLPGVLRRQTLTAQQWREMRPVFISVR